MPLLLEQVVQLAQAVATLFFQQSHQLVEVEADLLTGALNMPD
jgi:hypothetical protein